MGTKRLAIGFGWGLVGAAIAPRIATATLVARLVRGFTLGLLADRKGEPRPPKPPRPRRRAGRASRPERSFGATLPRSAAYSHPPSDRRRCLTEP